MTAPAASAGIAIDLVPFEPSRLSELVRMWRASFEAGVGIVEPHPIEEQQQYFVTQVLLAHEVRPIQKFA